MIIVILIMVFKIVKKLISYVIPISFGSVVLAATSKNRGMYIKIGIGIFDYGVL